jgi:HSP20 family protein
MTEKSTQIDVKNSGATTPQATSNLQHPFRSLRQQIDRLIEDFDRTMLPGHWFDMTPFAKLKSDMGMVVPAIDVVDDGNSYRVTAELPGISEKNIDVTKDGDFLTIKGEKKEEREQKEKGYFMSERSFGSFERSLRLPNGIDDSKIAAKFENGVLTVTLPKTAETVSKPKKIDIKAA